MPPSSPSLTSGRRGIKDPIVENLNVLVSSAPQKYHFIKHGFKIGARLTKHTLEGEGVNLGFDVRCEGIKEGPLDLQLNSPTDQEPLGGHILKITRGTRIEYFGVSDSNYPEDRNQVVRGNNACIQMLNPFFQGLLSADLGDSLQQTFSKAAGDTTIATNPQNHRTAATKAYTATLADGSALPAGITINASTGVISIVALTVAAADLEIKVVATDTLTTLPANHPWRVLDCEQTLYLTVTA